MEIPNRNSSDCVVVAAAAAASTVSIADVWSINLEFKALSVAANMPTFNKTVAAANLKLIKPAVSDYKINNLRSCKSLQCGLGKIVKKQNFVGFLAWQFVLCLTLLPAVNDNKILLNYSIGVVTFLILIFLRHIKNKITSKILLSLKTKQYLDLVDIT